MTHLAFSLFGNDEILGNFGMWVFLSVGAVALFAVFIPLVTYIDSRRKEREAFYKAETFRRLAESSGEGARAALEFLQEENRMRVVKAREGMKIAGLICVGVGAAMVILLRSQHDPAFLVGLIPAAVGLALLSYVFFLSTPVDPRPNR
jgi:peptidoglycan/LPS O-acetylase OafA/YrhL